MSKPVKELAQMLADSGAKIVIGLQQQGHFDTVTAMLADGKSWDEIGRAIRWTGKAAAQSYGIEVRSLCEELKAARAVIGNIAELRVENARLREKLNHLEGTSCDIDLARHWQARAEKAEAKNERLRVDLRDAANAMVQIVLRAEKAEAYIRDLNQRACKQSSEMSSSQVRLDRAELDLKVARHETKMAQEAVLLREADNVALREGLLQLLQRCESVNVAFSYQEAEELLANPNPGANVQGLIEAAEQYCEHLRSQHPDTLGDEDRLLLDAYALRGKEGEGDANTD